MTINATHDDAAALIALNRILSEVYTRGKKDSVGAAECLQIMANHRIDAYEKGKADMREELSQLWDGEKV